MQEDQTVSFQGYYESYLPWFAKLFLLYLLVIIGLILSRLVIFIWNLRKLRKLESNDPLGFNLLWTKCSAKADSLKDVAMVTFLLSLLNFCLSTTEILSGIKTEKTANWTYSALAIGDALRPFSFGIVICIALYMCSVFMKRVLRRAGGQ